MDSVFVCNKMPRWDASLRRGKQTYERSKWYKTVSLWWGLPAFFKKSQLQEVYTVVPDIEVFVEF